MRLGFVSTTVFDLANRTVASLDSLGKTTSTVYDQGSRPVAGINPLGFIATSVFDAANRLIATSGPPRKPNFLRLRRRRPSDCRHGCTREYKYDRIRRRWQGPGHHQCQRLRTTQVYDAVGQRARRHRRARETERVSRGTPTDGRPGQTDALNNVLTFQFDAASRQTLRIDGRGLRTSYVYDAADRLTGQQYQDGTRLTFTYDSDSRRTLLSDWTGSYTSTFDADSRLSTAVNPAGLVITYAYDAVGQRATMNQSTGRLQLRLRPRREGQQPDEPRWAAHHLVLRCEQPRQGKPAGQRNTGFVQPTTTPIACCCWLI